MKAHVSEAKKKEVKRLTELIRKYSAIGVIDMENMPAKQLQSMRALIRGNVELIVSKKRLMKIAIENCKNDKKGVDRLEEFLTGMPSFMFTNESPFKLANLLNKNKTPAPAKQGQKAPRDIIVKAGATNFMPGPIIGELGSLGIKSGVESGKVVIKSDSVVCKEGNVISALLAGMLTRLGIEPMEVGLNLVGVYENGLIYKKDVLSIDDEKVKNDMRKAFAGAFNLAFEIGYVTKDNVEMFIKKAFVEGKAIVVASGLVTDEKIKDYLKNAEMQALSLGKKLGTDKKVSEIVKRTKEFAESGNADAEKLIEEAGKDALKESDEERKKIESIAQDMSKTTHQR